MPTVRPHDATVLMVDAHLGLALLSADAAAMTTSYGIGPEASPGDSVTVVGATPTSATVSLDADGHLTLDGWADSAAEGTPVLNADGQFVGICSHGSSGPVVGQRRQRRVRCCRRRSRQRPAPWMGLHVTANDQGALVDRQGRRRRTLGRGWDRCRRCHHGRRRRRSQQCRSVQGGDRRPRARTTSSR